MSRASLEVNVINISPHKPPLGEGNGNAINDTLTEKKFSFCSFSVILYQKELKHSCW